MVVLLKKTMSLSHSHSHTHTHTHTHTHSRIYRLLGAERNGVHRGFEEAP